MREELTITWYKHSYYDTHLIKKSGEHHFCSIYLLNKFNRIPRYINPDGTKNVSGDIVFYKNDDTKFSIEVKYEKIKFTKNQYNQWFVDNSDKPDVLIALTDNYLFILEWKVFSKIYATIYPNGHSAITGYSKTISEDRLIKSEELKKDIDYFDLHFPVDKKIEKKINSKFKSLNKKIDNCVKRRGGESNNIGPSSIRRRTSERLFIISKNLFTDEILAKYNGKKDFEEIINTNGDLFIDMKGSIYCRINGYDYWRYNLKIPELLDYENR